MDLREDEEVAELVNKWNEDKNNPPARETNHAKDHHLPNMQRQGTHAVDPQQWESSQGTHL
jgi:hypothetical protein